MNKLLDACHILIIVFGLTMGFYFPVPVVLTLIAIHRLHVMFFDGCVFSHLQRRRGTLSEGKDFLQHLAYSLLKIPLSHRGARILDYSFSIIAVTIAFIHQVHSCPQINSPYC